MTAANERMSAVGKAYEPLAPVDENPSDLQALTCQALASTHEGESRVDLLAAGHLRIYLLDLNGIIAGIAYIDEEGMIVSVDGEVDLVAANTERGILAARELKDDDDDHPARCPNCGEPDPDLHDDDSRAFCEACAFEFPPEAAIEAQMDEQRFMVCVDGGDPSTISTEGINGIEIPERCDALREREAMELARGLREMFRDDTLVTIVLEPRR